MYNLIEYRDNYSNASEILRKQCRDPPAVNNGGAIIDFTEANATDSFNFKQKKQQVKQATF